MIDCKIESALRITLAQGSLALESGSNIPRMQEEYFFNKGPIFISKHHRFADFGLTLHTIWLFLAGSRKINLFVKKSKIEEE